VSEPAVLAIDQGTTSSRALVVSLDGRVLGSGQHPFPQEYPRPGWVEHDPEEIWRSTERAIRDALAAAGMRPQDVAAVGITNQRETLVLWERESGRPLGRAIVWQDRRTAPICAELRERGLEPLFRRRTGLTIDPYFTGTKLTWVFREHPELMARARRGEIAAGTVDAWLVWRLTGGRAHVTDYTNACRTLLFDIAEGRWDEELCDALEVPIAILPEVRPSIGPVGETDPGVFGAAVPIAGIAGDQQAAAFGQGCLSLGRAKNTYGTGAFLLAFAGHAAFEPPAGLLLSLGARSRPGQPEYLLEGSIFVAGAVVQWLRDELRIIERSEDVEALAASVPDTGGVVFVPAFTGLGAPHWDPHARGLLIGLTRGTTSAHIARAALEAIALSSWELLELFDTVLPEPVRVLRVDGGAARNDLLMQLQAALAGVTVERPTNIETTAMGAAMLAAIGAGLLPGPEEVERRWQLDRRFEPRGEEAYRRAVRSRWREAVRRSQGWASIE